MSFLTGLFGKGKSASTQQTAAVGLQVQTSVNGKPIPIIYGMTRVAPNLMWYGDFLPVQQSSSVGGKGGITGAGGKGGGSGSYVYSASFQCGLGEGSIESIQNVYIDKTVESTSTAGLSVGFGEYQQQPWSYLIGQQTPVTETHTINGSAQVTVNQPSSYYQDGGVTLSGVTNYTSTGGTPAAGQYNVKTFQSVNGWQVSYTFNAANAGANVNISVGNSAGPTTIYNETIPASAPYTITIPGGGNLFVDGGVKGTGTPLTPVGSSPTANEYVFAPGGIYTFNSSRIGATVTISYYTFSGTAALGYSGVAWVAAANYQLGNNPSLPNFNFEVGGIFSQRTAQSVQGEQYTLPTVGALVVTVRFAPQFLADEGVTDQNGNVYTKVNFTPGTNEYVVSAGTYSFGSGNAGQIVNINYSASIGPDADPSLVVNDYLTNAHYGVGFATGLIGNLSTYQAYCLATGLVISPCYDTQAQASSSLDDIAKATNSEFVWSSGQLTLVPYGDQAVTANGYTYTPPNAPLYSLTDDDFLPNTNLTASASASFNDDPVLMTRTRQADAYNLLKLEWLDRGNNYSPAIVQASDLASINSYGQRADSTRSFHLFCNGYAAQISVQLQLQRLNVRNIYQFTLDQRYVLLDPMDIVAITDTNLGLNQQWVRIREITENDDSSLSIVAKEYLQGTGTAPVYSLQQGQGFNANYNASPGDTNTPVIFEPPAELAEALEVWLAVSGGPNWGGCYVWISQDNETYQNVGKITGPSRQGFVDAPLPAVMLNGSGLTIDQTNTLAADISLSGGQLLSATPADAQAYATLCYLGSGNTYELMAYQTATLVSQNFYDLTYLVRGAYDSDILTHSAGEQFARLDASIFKYPYAQANIGAPLYIKLLSFNVYAGGQQNLGDVEPYTFVLQGIAYSSPLPNVGNLRTSYVASITQLNWDEITDFRPVLYEVRKGASWQGGQVLGRVAHPPFNVQGNGTYWVSAYSQPVPGLQVYSEAPMDIAITGAQIVSNVIATWDEAATGWSGTEGGAAALSGGNIALGGSGNILADPDYLNTPDILYFGGVGSSGTYTIPNGHIVNIGYVAPCSVIISSTSIGQHTTDNILPVADYLNFQDVLDASAQALVNVYANIAVSQDGVTWGPWFKWTPGSYIGMAFKAQAVLESTDPTVTTILEEFVFEVDVPDRDDHYTNVSIGSGGTAITFQPDGASSPAAFNGGPSNGDLPAVQVTILNSSAGDTLLLTGLTLSGCNIEIVNGGVGVARSINVLAEGY